MEVPHPFPRPLPVHLSIWLLVLTLCHILQQTGERERFPEFCEPLQPITDEVTGTPNLQPVGQKHKSQPGTSD